MKAHDLTFAASIGGGTALIAASSAFAQGTGQDMGPGMMGWYGGWGMVFGPFFMIFWLAVAIVVVVLLVRWLGGPWHMGHSLHGTEAPLRTPMDILKERFARGEIDEKEYDERRRILEE